MKFAAWQPSLYSLLPIVSLPRVLHSLLYKHMSSDPHFSFRSSVHSSWNDCTTSSAGAGHGSGKQGAQSALAKLQVFTLNGMCFHSRLPSFVQVNLLLKQVMAVTPLTRHSSSNTLGHLAQLVFRHVPSSCHVPFSIFSSLNLGQHPGSPFSRSKRGSEQ